MIFAGHGITTIGLLLLRGDANEWLAGQSWGWKGVVVILAAICTSTQRLFLVVLTFDNVCLFASILFFVIQSDGISFSMIISIPFCWVILVLGWKCWSAFRKEEDKKSEEIKTP